MKPHQRIDIFYFLNVNDFYLIRITCKHFHRLTKPSKARINKYWQLQSILLCNEIETDYPKYKIHTCHLFYHEIKYKMSGSNLYLKRDLIF